MGLPHLEERNTDKAQYVHSNKHIYTHKEKNNCTHKPHQAAIVAVSTCHDVFETLEKRVQSRFVHSKFGVAWYCYSQQPGECIYDILESMLVVPPKSCAKSVDHNAAVKRALGVKSVKEALRKMSLHCTLVVGDCIVMIMLLIIIGLG